MIPSLELANVELNKAAILNPGLWVQHSMNVAEGARLIASRCDGLDEKMAYVFGLLHDIGRKVGFVAKRHIWEGYQYMTAMGWFEVARICLTHSFPIKNIDMDLSKDDLLKDERDYIRWYLSKIEYDDYDKLIILCDSLADAKGFCLLEKRFIDTARRYGIYPYSLDRWNKTFEYKEYFEDMMEMNVYDILPNVKITTFDTLPIWSPTKN